MLRISARAALLILLSFLLPHVIMSQTATSFSSITGGLEPHEGTDIDISGNYGIVGAPGDWQTSGVAYTISFNGTNWNFHEFLAPVYGPVYDPCLEQFGDKVAIDDSTAVVVSRLFSYNNNPCTRVFIFNLVGNSWIETQIITPTLLGSAQITALDIHGDFIVLGSITASANSFVNAGAVTVLKLDTAGWIETQKITASDAASYDNFGREVSILGNRLLIGCPSDDYNGLSEAGSAYVFEYDGTNWIEMHKLIPQDTANGNRFGVSVSLDLDQCLIGSNGDAVNGSNSGSAYMFEFIGSSWLQTQKITPSDGSASDKFGQSAGLSGGVAVIGAPEKNSLEGAAYLFRNLGGSWIEIGRLRPEFASPWYFCNASWCEHQYGKVVAVSGSSIGIGSPRFSYGTGAAYVWQLDSPANNLCASAIPLTAPLFCGTSADLNGSTVFASNIDAPSYCGTALDMAAGVWYSLTGTGDTITASLCGSEFDTKIAVFKGSCGNLTCVSGNDDFCGVQATVSFKTIPGESYYLYVTGFGQREGIFTLSIDCTPSSIPSNDACLNAIPIACGSTVLESTSASSNADAPLACGTTVNTAPGIWYTLYGTGDSITLSLCSSTYDTKVAVYSGTCGNLTCITGNDDACGLFSQVRFSTAVSVQYLIYVTGYASANGFFEMEVSCGQANDLCQNAIILKCGDSANGSTVNASTQQGLPVCDNNYLSESPGVWYAFIGAGENVTASLCGSGYDTRIGVFTDACANAACIAANDDACGLQSAVSFIANAGQTYYIYVSGFQAQVGNYMLSLSCTPSACANDAPLASSSNVTSSSVLLNWSPVPGSTGYQILGGVLGGSIVTLNAPSTANSFQVNNLPPLTTFVWAVRSKCTIDGSILSGLSNIDTFTTKNPCMTPATAYSSFVTFSSATLMWSSVPTATSYTIKGNKLGVTPDITITVNSINPLTVQNLQSGTSYSWMVRANCSSGFVSAFTQRDTFTTLTPSTPKHPGNPEIEKNLVRKFSIHPNPASSFVGINVPEDHVEETIHVKLFDINGRLVLFNDLDCINGKSIWKLGNSVTDGVYYLKAISGTRVYSQKLVVRNN